MLRLDAVTVRFGGLVAVRGVSFGVAPGEFVGLVGPNGAGKTTLFNAISGLVRPNGGAIVFESHDILKAPLHRRARLGIGRTFQIPQPMCLLTVRENLRVAQRFATGAVDDARIDEILGLLGLAAKAAHDAATGLTLTELKLLEIGKALAIRPRLLLLDEVLAGLETAGKRHFAQLLTGLHAKSGIGMLMIEHDIETISALCTRVCVLDAGSVIAEGPPDAVFRNPDVVRSYTGAGGD
jgi:branched-chain amino acid transport system ATP-binding protein